MSGQAHQVARAIQPSDVRNYHMCVHVQSSASDTWSMNEDYIY